MEQNTRSQNSAKEIMVAEQEEQKDRNVISNVQFKENAWENLWINNIFDCSYKESPAYVV